ncbi:MAG: hypothetical protein M1829_006318 [Trizodia sp. TS-e1964]|nr:MAG: hypothetical protein M1829_006318 [Trizodia sp. TS-e1964]
MPSSEKLSTTDMLHSNKSSIKGASSHTPEERYALLAIKFLQTFNLGLIDTIKDAEQFDDLTPLLEYYIAVRKDLMAQLDYLPDDWLTYFNPADGDGDAEGDASHELKKYGGGLTPEIIERLVSEGEHAKANLAVVRARSLMPDPPSALDLTLPQSNSTYAKLLREEPRHYNVAPPAQESSTQSPTPLAIGNVAEADGLASAMAVGEPARKHARKPSNGRGRKRSAAEADHADAPRPDEKRTRRSSRSATNADPKKSSARKSGKKGGLSIEAPALTVEPPTPNVAETRTRQTRSMTRGSSPASSQGSPTQSSRKRRLELENAQKKVSKKLAPIEEDKPFYEKASDSLLQSLNAKPISSAGSQSLTSSLASTFAMPTQAEFSAPTSPKEAPSNPFAFLNKSSTNPALAPATVKSVLQNSPMPAESAKPRNPFASTTSFAGPSLFDRSKLAPEPHAVSPFSSRATSPGLSESRPHSVFGSPQLGPDSGPSKPFSFSGSASSTPAAQPGSAAPSIFDDASGYEESHPGNPFAGLTPATNSPNADSESEEDDNGDVDYPEQTESLQSTKSSQGSRESLSVQGEEYGAETPRAKQVGSVLWGGSLGGNSEMSLQAQGGKSLADRLTLDAKGNPLRVGGDGIAKKSARDGDFSLFGLNKAS